MIVNLKWTCFNVPNSAPSGRPQSVMMSSVTSGNITVQWGRVSCIDRNSEITGYTVRYGQTGSTTTVMESVSGTSDSDRMFTASGLIPRTSYTFEVAAVSTNNGTGSFSTGISVETTVFEGILYYMYIAQNVSPISELQKLDCFSEVNFTPTAVL